MQTIHWWFADAGAPRLEGPHVWGSLNWEVEPRQPGPLGEVVGAARPWRNGSKPANACGGPAVAGCWPHPLPSTLYVTYHASDIDLSFPINLDPGSHTWEGSLPVNYGSCVRLYAAVTCGPTPDGVGASLRLELFGDQAGGGFGTVHDNITSPADPATPLDHTFYAGPVKLTCVGLPVDDATVRFSEYLPGRLALATVL